MFRQEAINAKKQRLQGRVIATQPTSMYVICVATFLIFCVIVLFLCFTQFSRKETVKGYVIPSKGVLKVFANRSGVVDELHVQEGEFISEGEQLFTIKNSQSLATGIEFSEVLGKQFRMQSNTLKLEIKYLNILFDKEMKHLDIQTSQLERALKVVSSELNVNKKALDIKKSALEKSERLFSKGYISESQLNNSKKEYFSALESHSQLQRDKLSREIELSSVRARIDVLPETLAQKEAEIRREIAGIMVQLAELDSQFIFIQKAPESGMITAIQPNLGMRVETTSPILSIIPSNAPLEVELLLPTRSAGFIETNGDVKIRFDAFPYQKFGTMSGKIVQIDKSLILPTEKSLPITIKEAMYRVRVSIASHSITAYGKEFDIKVGMSVEADIILDTRPLLDWLLDPIYAIRGKLG